MDSRNTNPAHAKILNPLSNKNQIKIERGKKL
jgi:hypothetical protein